VCGFIGLVVAVYPELWIGMFSQSTEVSQIGALYLHMVGPAYVFFGMGLGLFFVTQGYGRGVAGMAANAARLIASVGAGLLAVYWVDAGRGGFFGAIALSFCLYAALLAASASRIMKGASPVP
jgi:Na+-driven multidrug efflux pump